MGYLCRRHLKFACPECHSDYQRQLEKGARDIGDVRRGPDFLLHVILDYVVDRKFESIEALQEELDNAEEIILKTPTSFNPESVLRLRKSLLALRKSLFHEREVMLRLCRRDSPFVTEKAIYHFRDVYDHLAKFFEAIEIYRDKTRGQANFDYNAPVPFSF